MTDYADFEDYEDFGDECPELLFDDDTDTTTYCYLVKGHAGTHEGQTDLNEIVNWD